MARTERGSGERELCIKRGPQDCGLAPTMLGCVIAREFKPTRNDASHTLSLSATWRLGRTPQPGRFDSASRTPSMAHGCRHRGMLAVRAAELLLIELGGDAILLRVAAARGPCA